MLHAILERHWQSPNSILRLLLRPLAILFGKIAARRRARYLAGSLKSEKLPVPVVSWATSTQAAQAKHPLPPRWLPPCKRVASPLASSAEATDAA